MLSAIVSSFRETGIETIDPFLDAPTVDSMAALADPLLSVGSGRKPGIRRVLVREPRLGEVIGRSVLPELMALIGGPGCRVVRAVLFDKSPESNWLVPWHQDATIAVTERREVSGFGPWAVKDGEHHCQPSAEVLASIFTIRVHLDACTAESGPLRVSVGSHRRGLLDDAAMSQCIRDGVVREAITGRGGVVLTTPLAVHSSPKSARPELRRRVLHLDCTAFNLPGGLSWAESWPPNPGVLSCGP